MPLALLLSMLLMRRPLTSLHKICIPEILKAKWCSAVQLMLQTSISTWNCDSNFKFHVSQPTEFQDSKAKFKNLCQTEPNLTVTSLWALALTLCDRLG